MVIQDAGPSRGLSAKQARAKGMKSSPKTERREAFSCAWGADGGVLPAKLPDVSEVSVGTISS